MIYDVFYSLLVLTEKLAFCNNCKSLLHPRGTIKVSLVIFGNKIFDTAVNSVLFIYKLMLF